MTRQRISTTVDAERLRQCRELVDTSDSELVDAALSALLRELLGDRERIAIESAPYEEDPALAWQAPPGPDLPYDGAVPDEVQQLAAERRAGYPS